MEVVRGVEVLERDHGEAPGRLVDHGVDHSGDGPVAVVADGPDDQVLRTVHCASRVVAQVDAQGLRHLGRLLHMTQERVDALARGQRLPPCPRERPSMPRVRSPDSCGRSRAVSRGPGRPRAPARPAPTSRSCRKASTPSARSLNLQSPTSHSLSASKSLSGSRYSATSAGCGGALKRPASRSASLRSRPFRRRRSFRIAPGGADSSRQTRHRDPSGAGFLLDDPHGGFLLHVGDLVGGETEVPGSVGQLGGHRPTGIRGVEDQQETEGDGVAHSLMMHACRCLRQGCLFSSWLAEFGSVGFPWT